MHVSCKAYVYLYFQNFISNAISQLFSVFNLMHTIVWRNGYTHVIFSYGSGGALGMAVLVGRSRQKYQLLY